jgi:amino acid transporter
VPSCFLSSKLFPSRPFKVLNLSAQLQLICLLSALLIINIDRELHAMHEIEALISQAEVWGVTMLTVIIMRVIHPLFSLMNYRSLKASSNLRAIIYTVSLMITALGAQIGTFFAVNHISDNHRSKILHCTLKVCAFELLIWDLIV